MTDLLLDYDPNDTGEVNRLPGEHRTRIDLGEPTQRIDPRLIDAPSFDAVPRKTFDLDDTVVYHPETIGFVDLEGPQKPPPPLPKPKADLSETGVNIFGGLGADLPDPPHDRAAWPAPTPAGSRSICRHKVKVAFQQGLVIGALGMLAVYSGLVLAALVVVR